MEEAKPTLEELRRQKIKESAERTRQLSLANAEKERELVPMSEAQQVITDVFLPLRSALMALRGSLASRCNPSDPQLAGAAIGEAVNEILSDAEQAATKAGASVARGKRAKAAPRRKRD